MNTVEKLSNYMAASYPLLYMVTHEESRAIKEITDKFDNHAKVKVCAWDVKTGLQKREPPNKWVNMDGTAVTKYSEIMDKINDMDVERHLFILKDYHPYIEAPGSVRAMRHMIPNLKKRGNMVLFLSPIVKVPIELDKDIQFLDFALPDEPAIDNRLEFIRASFHKAKGNCETIDPTVKRVAINSAKGMTISEIDNAFSLGAIEHNGFNDGFVSSVFTEKIEKVKKNGLLTYIEPNIGFDDIGGMDGLKKWILVRSKAYSAEARDYGLPFPKGVLLCSPPGCGNNTLTY